MTIQFDQFQKLITSPYISIACIIVFTIIIGLIINYCKRRSPITPLDYV